MSTPPNTNYFSGLGVDFSLVDADRNPYHSSEPFTGMWLLVANGGTICSHGFSQMSANAIFNKMGISGPVLWFTGRPWTVQDQYPVKYRYVHCGSSSWSSCSLSLSNSGCSHSNDIFFTMFGNQWFIRILKHIR